jgi:hypothetical protein
MGGMNSNPVISDDSGRHADLLFPIHVEYSISNISHGMFNLWMAAEGSLPGNKIYSHRYVILLNQLR